MNREFIMGFVTLALAVSTVGCVTVYQAPSAGPKANFQFESQTIQKSGLYEGRLVLVVSEVHESGFDKGPPLGEIQVAGSKQDGKHAVAAGKNLQFKAVFAQPAPGVFFNCFVPFKFAPADGESYLIRMDFDRSTKVCDLELHLVSRTPSQKIGTSSQASHYTTFGLATNEFTPKDKASNPQF